MGKKIGHPPRRLSIVGSKANSKPDTNTPAAQSDPEEVRRKRLEALERGRAKSLETRRIRSEKIAERKAAGERSRLEMFRAGDLPVSEWTDDEISNGKPIGLDGTFSGGYPSLTGRQQQQIKAELLKRAQRRFDGLLDVAIETLMDVAKNGETESARVKASSILMERAAGKVPDRIEIKSSDPWQDILDEIMDDEVLTRMSDHHMDDAHEEA